MVEDNHSDRSWLTQTLSNAGYSVEAAATAAEAVRLCNQRAFAAITLDLVLPDASGWEVLRELRSTPLNHQVPVIVVTLSPDQGLSSAFLIQDYLLKPVDEQTLLESLKRAGLHPGGGVVLLVDEDMAMLKLVSAKLSQLGYRTVCESTAEHALEVIANEPPAVIVLELLLPCMNGFQFLNQLRRTAEGRQIPVIVWTTKDLSMDERLRLRDSAQAIVPRDGACELLEQLKPYLPSPQPEPGHSLKGNA